MENAVDGIKIAFGMFVFVLALALAVSVIGQARATSEVVFHSNDKTEFYQYVTHENIANTKNRIVGIETVIPTIHRYAKEQFAVTIFDKNGNPIARYDLWTEGSMNNWDQILRDKEIGNAEMENYNEIKNRLQKIQDVVNKTMGKEVKVKTDAEIENDIKRLYKVKNDINKSITVGAPWGGNNEEIQKRIKADMLGETYENNLVKYIGKNLKNYKDSKFIEKFLEITTDGATVTDEGDSLETIKGNKKLEIIYIISEDK